MARWRPRGRPAGGGRNAVLGVGANALIGGFNKSVGLQPLSIQAQTGLNVAAGIADLELHYRGKE